MTENLIKNHNMFSKNEFRQFIYEFRHFRKFCNRSCFLAVRIRFLYIHDMVGNFMDSWIGIYADNGSDIQRF